MELRLAYCIATAWLLLCAFCCASISTYTLEYFGLVGVDYSKGQLLGPSSAQDLPFSQCQGNKCVIMLSEKFFQLKADYEDTKMRLQDCEKK